MKSDLQAKYIQYLSQKKQDEGFTLIELLVVIIIIGILSAIALPSFLNQAAKAKQSEAKTYVGSVNRAQQAYRIDNPAFATDIVSLEIGIPTDTPHYTYTIASAVTTALANANAKDAASLRSFTGGVVIKTTGQTEAVACQTNGVTSTAPGATLTTVATTPSSCPSGSQAMK